VQDETRDELAASPGRLPLVLLGSLVITGIGQTLLYALLPLASRQLGMSEYQASAVFALSALFWSGFSPVWGRLSDRTQGVWVLALGMIGQAASNLAVGLVFFFALRGALPHPWVFPLLLTLRGINGVLGSAVLPSAQGLALRSAPHKPRIAIIGSIATCWNIGTMSGPGFATVLIGLGTGAPLFVSAGLAVLAAGVVLARAPAGAGSVIRAVPRRGAARLVRARIWPFMAMILATGTANAIVAQATAYVILDRLSLPPARAHAVIGIALSLVAARSVAAQTAAIRLRPAAHRLMTAGAAMIAIAAVAILLLPNVYVLLPALAVTGMGLGIGSLGISTAASLLMRPAQQGAVAGALASASSLGAIVSALGVMPFYHVMPNLPYLAVAVLGAGVAVASRLAPRRSGLAAP